MAAGALQAWFLLGSPAALWGHRTWALALIAKMALLAGILVLGARNRRRTAQLADHRVATVLALRRAMRAEVLFGVLVLAATATLVRSVPPVDAVPVSGPVVREVPAGPLRIRLELPSPRVGSNDVRVFVVDGHTGRPASRVADVSLRLSQPERRIGPLRFSARRVGPGRYDAPAITLGIPGTWRAEVTARVSEFDEFTGRADIPIGR
jgi:copper transport protein